MKYVEVVTDSGSADTVSAIAEAVNAFDFRRGAVDEQGIQTLRLLVADDKIQSALDSLQTLLGAKPLARIAVLPVETALPKSPEVERKVEDAAVALRESLYEEVEKNSRMDKNFMILLMLSTAVAAIGLIESNVAVVIGAMVIAPLLGPNLAFGLGTALGDVRMMRTSALTTSAGIAISVALSFAIGSLWLFDVSSPELMARTEVGLDSVALALASGAAAALSLTTGLSSVLVGVMVAVALLPPAVALGLMLGQGNIDLAGGAGLLLAINLVCVNLASKLVFFVKGIGPRTGLEKRKAARAMTIYILVWIVTLLILVFIIYSREALVA